MEFQFSEEKNSLLFRERGITFYKVIESINEKGILLNIDHPNKEKHPGQKILVVNVDDFAYCVPYTIKGDKYYLITAFPSRKFKYLLEGD